MGANITVLSGLGEIGLTGFDPTVETPKNVLPDVGGISLTGFSPLVQTPVNLNSDFGVITLTGYEPIISVGVTLDVLPDTGLITLVGRSPFIRIKYYLYGIEEPKAKKINTKLPPIFRGQRKSINPGIYKSKKFR